MEELKKVETILDTYCTSKIAQAATIDARYAQLWQEVHFYLMNGGKRTRPRLVLLAHDAYNTSGSNVGMPEVAAAWELLHACLLVHDDIIDRDTYRHGQPNIAGRYLSTYSELTSSDISHYALSAALLGGNLLLMGAYEMLAMAPIESEAKLLAQSQITKALFTVAGGELIDTDAVLYPINQSDPYSVAVHKTASYSLQLPLQCGAALAGATASELEKLSSIGLHAGVAYQLRDDLLGVFGESATTGKSNRSDIVEKKRTLLIHKALENLEKPQQNRLLELFALDHIVSSEEAEEIVDLVIASDAKSVVEKMIDEEAAQALSVIATLSVDDSHKDHFNRLIEKLVTRSS